MKRSEFIARVSGALGRDAQSSVAAPPQLRGLSDNWNPADLAEPFRQELEAVGGRLHTPESFDEAPDLIDELARDSGAVSFARSNDPVLDPLLSTLSLPRADKVSDAGVGITGAIYGVASTGSIVLSSEAGRLASLLPLCHIVVLRKAQLVPDIAVTLSCLREKLPSGIFFATGPSRTADIEMTLNTGVHGPGDVEVILLP